VLSGPGPDADPRAVVANKGYDATTNREAARNRGICPVIPHRADTIDSRSSSQSSSTKRGRESSK